MSPRKNVDPLLDADGIARCSYCDTGVLRQSKLDVHQYKRERDERLWSCFNCGRCFLVSVERNSQRIYKDLYEYRALRALMRESRYLTTLDAEKRFRTHYTANAPDDVSWKAFRSAWDLALATFGLGANPAKSTNPAQHVLFEEDAK